MILPIGHEERAAPRLPWVTFLLIASCLGAWIAIDPQALGRSSPLEEAARYWVEHAYLEAEPEVLAEVLREIPPEGQAGIIRSIRFEGLENEPLDRERVAAEQRELDRLSERAASEGRGDGSSGARSGYARWGLVAAHPRTLTFFTHSFIHAGWLPLLGNLFILFLAGPPLEARWGRPLFAAFYLLAGLASGAAFIAYSPGAPIPRIGASGAIAAVLGACFVLFWRRRIHFAFLFLLNFRFLRVRLPVPAPLLLCLGFANELFLAWATQGLEVQGGFAYSGQIGGFVFGTACALAMRVSHIEERLLRPAGESELAGKRSPVIEQAMKLRERGELQRARTLLEDETRRRPGDPHAVLAFWEVACALQQAELAAPAMLRWVHKCLAQGKHELAARYWREMTEAAPQVRAEPSVLVRLAPVLLESGQREKAILALQQAVEAQDPRPSAALALRIARLARSLDAGIALRAARCALDAEQLPDAKRDRIEELVATLEVVHARAEEKRPRDEESPPSSDLHEPDAVDLDGAEEIVGTEVPEATACSGARELPAEFGAASSAGLEEGLELEPPGEPILESPDAGPELSEPGSSLPRFVDVKLMEAAPVGWEEEGLALRLGEGKRAILAYEKIEALAVAAVNRLSSKPVLVIDLILNWNDSNQGALKLVRLRSDGFDPRDLVPSGARPAEALREILARLLAESRAIPLPDAESALGRPFQAFEDLETYQREVLQVSS